MLLSLSMGWTRCMLGCVVRWWCHPMQADITDIAASGRHALLKHANKGFQRPQFHEAADVANYIAWHLQLGGGGQLVHARTSVNSLRILQALNNCFLRWPIAAQVK